MLVIFSSVISRKGSGPDGSEGNFRNRTMASGSFRLPRCGKSSPQTTNISLLCFLKFLDVKMACKYYVEYRLLSC